jgi:heme-degrading monooxygenase HmoA
MYARVSTFEGMMSDHLDEAVRVAREQFIPAAQQSGGFEGMYLLGDLESGKALSISLWSSREAMQTSEEQANRSREEAAHDAQGRVTNVERYEVVLSPQQASPATERAAQTVQEGVATTGQTVGGLLGAATGAVTDVTAGTVGAAAEGTERAVEAVAFPIEGYDEMNVDEISKRLNDLSVEELQVVRDYEELNKRRESLLERMDRKIRSA